MLNVFRPGQEAAGVAAVGADVTHGRGVRGQGGEQLGRTVTVLHPGDGDDDQVCIARG